MTDPEKFEKEAAKQRLYMILSAALVLQVLVVAGLFAFGSFEGYRTIIRTVVVVELVVLCIIYGYIRFKGAKR